MPQPIRVHLCLYFRAMIYFENASRGEEGFNTHLMSYTLCLSLSNFLERDFFFDFEIPSSSPPEYASDPEYNDKFRILLESPRSRVSELVDIPNRRVSSIDREVGNKAEFQLLHSYFVTTEELKKALTGTILWDSFAVGRHCLTLEQLQEFRLIEWTHSKLTTPAFFYFLRRPEKQILLDSVRIRYLDEIEKLARKITREFGRFYACHIRLGVFQQFFDDYSPDVDRFRDYVSATFKDTSRPILIATESLQKKDILKRIFPGFQFAFIDELIFDEYEREYKELPFTDFNVITILNQLICSAAETFIGTYQSTFTAIIHRLRQERFGKKDFYFFPDPKIMELLTADHAIAPDRHGFFDWNRYSAFAEDHAAMAWMREWDHDLTSIDL